MAKNAIRAFSSMTADAAAATATKINAVASDLYRRLLRLGDCRRGSVEQTMDKWVMEGNPVKKYQIQSYIRELRKFKRYSQALELMDWMKSKGVNFSRSNHAVRIHLLSKTKGNCAAEEYFESLPNPEKNMYTYVSLLSCYCSAEEPDKALGLLARMKAKNIVFNTLAYNNLMCMYMKLGQPEKILPLFHEMKDNKIIPNTFTYNLVITSYSALKGVEAVEKAVDEMKGGKWSPNWTTYSLLASIYIAAGDFKKANATLKQLEENITCHATSDRKPFHFLITMYASTRNSAGVKRAFESLKSTFPEMNNTSYLHMLQALSKLDDLNGLRLCFEEWEAGHERYDVRLANVLVGAYLRQDMIKEAKLLYEDVMMRGVGPNFRTLELFIVFYSKNDQIDLAMQLFEEAVAKSENAHGTWQPRKYVVTTFLKHFERAKDVERAENFYKKLKRVNYLDLEVYTSLLQTYVAAGQTEPFMRQRIELDKIEIDSETEELLRKVCPTRVLWLDDYLQS